LSVDEHLFRFADIQRFIDDILAVSILTGDRECVDLKDVRNKHFVASSIKDLFDSIEAHKIIDFIKETRFYKQL